MGGERKRKANSANQTRERHDPAHGAVERNADSGCHAAARGRGRVVPGGMWGHMNAARLPEGYPQFFAPAEAAGSGMSMAANTSTSCAAGARSCSAIIIPRSRPRPRRRSRGDCMNGPGEAMVELAEDLVDMLPHADWAKFQKNGSDATTDCVTIARAGTGRRKVLVARGPITARCRGARQRCRRDRRGSGAYHPVRIQ